LDEILVEVDLSKVAGDILPAELPGEVEGENKRGDPVYVHSCTDKPLTVNQYADRQPGAKLWSKEGFGKLLDKIESSPNDASKRHIYDGVYYVK
jgi:hypothetical protein